MLGLPGASQRKHPRGGCQALHPALRKPPARHPGNLFCESAPRWRHLGTMSVLDLPSAWFLGLAPGSAAFRSAAAPPTGPLRVHPDNSRYFADGGKNPRWFPPRRADGYGEDPPAWNQGQVSLLDTDHIWGVSGNAGSTRGGSRRSRGRRGRAPGRREGHRSPPGWPGRRRGSGGWNRRGRRRRRCRTLCRGPH